MPNVKLRRFDLDADSLDTGNFFSWRCDPETIKDFVPPVAPTFVEHIEWQRRRLEHPGCVPWIVEHLGKSVGHVRTTLEAGEDDHMLSLLIAPAWRNQGIGREALHLLIATLPPGTKIHGGIRPGNVPSERIAMAIGLRLVDNRLVGNPPRYRLYRGLVPDR